MTTNFSAAWLSGDARATSLLDDGFRRPAARAAAVAAARLRSADPVVVDVVEAQSARFGADPARERSFALLRTPGTVVVATGQQVGLFGGPLYSVYKACSAITAARALAKETGAPAVPIFWLQTEDHDLPEIDHCVVPRANGEPLTLRLDEAESSSSSRIPVAHHRIPAAIADAHAALAAELGAQPHACEHLELLARAYVPGATLPHAFADLFGALFAGTGLLLVDPRDARLAPRAAPVHRRALDDALGIAAVLQARVDELLSAGLDAQVHVRPRSPLSFYAPDAVDGPRFRLERRADDAWRLVGRDDVVDDATLHRALDDEPLRFTTSALLRPLLQDAWFPTAAYVGGPGEVAYFAQLSPLYARCGVPMPMVVLRDRFRVVDDRARGLLAKLDLSADDAAQPVDALLARRAVRDHEAPDDVAQRLRAAIAPALQQEGARMAVIDPGLEKAAANALAAVDEALARLVAKYARALSRQDEATRAQVVRLQAMLFPGGAPQERVHGLPYYACRFGGGAFVQSVLGACEPFAAASKDLLP